jgi:hypothetical protein
MIKPNLRQLHIILTIGVLLFVGLVYSPVRAETLFEGYSRVLLSGSHVGFFVSRYEFDIKKKQFYATYLLKTNEAGGSINESLKAIANDKLEPVSYQYASANKVLTKTIEATFVKNKMKAKITVNGKSQKIEKTIQSGVFLSSFLAYVILKSPDGMKTGTKYEYQAIAEEDGEITAGIAYVKETENYKGLKGFKVVNEFKSMQFNSLATDKGEILYTSEPVQGIATELAADPAAATTGFSLSEKNLKTLFGTVPKGTENSLSKMLGNSQSNPNATNPNSANLNNKLAMPVQSPAPEAEAENSGTVKTNKPLKSDESTETPTKQMGVPGGKGLIIKPKPK